ncbi:MAG: sulfurtransferase [Cetobacterium sp.]
MKKLLALCMLLYTTIMLGKDYKQYRSDKLVSPEFAKEMLRTDKNVVIIDVRMPAKFLANNIDGSYNIWRPDMESKDKKYGDILGMRASREELEVELNKMGVTEDSTLLLIGNGLDEFRLWWILDLYGMEDVKIVDGGYSALKETGIKTKFGKTNIEKKGNFKFDSKEDKNTYVTIEEVQAAIGNSNKIIVDGRSRKEFIGAELKKGAAEKGRIPGSVWVEWTETLNEDKTLKSYSELFNLYKNKGVVGSKEVISYCQSGAKSAHTTFVLKELLGFPVAKNYDGSWIEWSRVAKEGKVKVETGE